MIIGIDIGTSFSSVTALADGKPAPVRVKTADSIFGDDFSMPTVVYAEGAGVLRLGQFAFNKKERDPGRFKKDFKRHFGTDIPYLLGDEQYLPQDLYTAIFLHFKQRAEEVHGPIGEAHITHPAMYSGDKKKLLERAAMGAGLINAVLLDEPTAAAIAYAQKASVNTGDRLLIYDLGGGTFDVSLIEKTAGGYRHLTDPLGLPECGGIDFDRAVSDDLLAFLRESGADVDAQMQNPRFLVSLPELCAKIKHQLTYEDAVEETVMAGDYYDYTLTRERFEELIRPYITGTMEKVDQTLENAGLDANGVSRVVLVGGSTYIPLVRQTLRERFGDRVSVDVDPVLAVASGAALWTTVQKPKAKPEATPKAKPEATPIVRPAAKPKSKPAPQPEQQPVTPAEQWTQEDFYLKGLDLWMKKEGKEDKLLASSIYKFWYNWKLESPYFVYHKGFVYYIRQFLRNFLHADKHTLFRRNLFTNQEDEIWPSRDITGLILYRDTLYLIEGGRESDEGDKDRVKMYKISNPDTNSELVCIFESNRGYMTEVKITNHLLSFQLGVFIKKKGLSRLAGVVFSASGYSGGEFGDLKTYTLNMDAGTVV